MRLTLLCLKENCAVLAEPRIVSIIKTDDSNSILIDAGSHKSMSASITKSSQMRLTLLRLKENCAVSAAPRIVAIMIEDDSNAGMIIAGGQGTMDAQSHSYNREHH